LNNFSVEDYVTGLEIVVELETFVGKKKQNMSLDSSKSSVSEIISWVLRDYAEPTFFQ
jgi:hypothetical protein